MKDPYTDQYGVLYNKLNIKSPEELNRAEADIGFMQLISIDTVPIDNTYDNETIIKSLHKHIFKDIFTWAGEFRTCPLVKEEFIFPGYSVPYSSPKDIKKELKKRMIELEAEDWDSMSTEQIASVFARRIALIWKVHPFRDGNTRATLSFACIYAKEHGFPMDMKTFTENLARIYYENGRVSRHSIRDKFVLASLDEKDYPEVEPLAAIFEEAMKKYQENNPEKEIESHK